MEKIIRLGVMELCNKNGKKGFTSDEADHGILGAIIVLRAMLTFLIHWEIGNEKKEARELQEQQGI